ncbi:MAG: hypothetical protein ACKOPI_03920 [bacterium]
MKKQSKRRLVAALATVSVLAAGVFGATSASAATGGLQITSVTPLTILGNTTYRFDGTITGPGKCRAKRSISILGANSGGSLSVLASTQSAKSGSWSVGSGERGVLLLKLKAKKVGKTRCPADLQVGVITGP